MNTVCKCYEHSNEHCIQSKKEHNKGNRNKASAANKKLAEASKIKGFDALTIVILNSTLCMT